VPVAASTAPKFRRACPSMVSNLPPIYRRDPSAERARASTSALPVESTTRAVNDGWYWPVARSKAAMLAAGNCWPPEPIAKVNEPPT